VSSVPGAALWKPTRTTVNLFKTEFTDDDWKVTRLPGALPQFIKSATRLLQLQRPTLQLYDENSDLVTEID